MDILLSFRSFLIAFLAYFKYRIISSANTDNLTSSFPVNIPCIYFPCLLGLAKDSSNIWNKSEKSGPPASFLILKEVLLIFCHSVQHWLFIMLAYIMWIHDPSVLCFFRAFIIKRYPVFQRLFLHLLR
jgi:hypothetical protein